MLLHLFARATITMCHFLGVLNNIDLLSNSFESLRSRIKVLSEVY
jgi:hypothetical protein